jgi:DNA-binding CsgD family transcriptional regulator
LPLLFQEFDELGRGVIVLDHSGRVRRQNARAEELLAGCFGRTDDDRCPLPLLLWIWTRHQLLRADAADPQRLPVALMLECAGRRVEFRLQARNGWILLVVDERRSAPNPSALRRLGLTPREAEVLAWVAEGKTNREVATILSMGPRTVQKHMEHVLAKLGAETRTAAARIALQVMHAS